VKKRHARDIQDDLNPQIFNRRYYRERLKEEIKHCNQYGRPLSLIVADVDHFKEVNDTYRHLVGDNTLAAVGQVLKESVRDTDIVCRYGGDEFVVILPDADQNKAWEIALGIHNGISEYTWNKNLPMEILTMSVGVATYRKEESSFKFFDRADKALYTAKKRGRNQVLSIESLSSNGGIEKDIPLDLSSPILVGRDNEIRFLKNTFQKLLTNQSPRGKILFFGGEAGVGKTSLITSIERLPRFSQVYFLKGACHVETRDIPYYPFINAFSSYFQNWGKDQKHFYRKIREIYRRELSKIIPQFDERGRKRSRADIPPDKLRLFEGFLILLKTMSNAKPLILFLDDLHWADEASLDLLQYISRRIEKESVLILGTYREEELAKSPLVKTIREMEGERLMENVGLPHLSHDAVTTLLTSAFRGLKVCSDFEKMVSVKTGGNPFFIMEILRSLGEENQKKVLDGGETQEFYESLILTESVLDMIHRRLEELDPEIREILLYCAVLGKEFHFDVLRYLSSRNEGNLFDILDKTVKRQLLEEVPGTDGEYYRFHHGLIGDVIYSKIQAWRKKLLHKEAGEVIEEYYREKLGEVSGNLTRHFFNGENYSKALLYAKKAGDRSKQLYANQEAIQYYTQAIKVFDHLNGNQWEDKFELLHSRSEIFGIVGKTEERKKDIENAIGLAQKKKDKKRLSDGFISQSFYYLQTGDFMNSLKSAEKALELKRKIRDKRGEAQALQRIGSVSTDMGDTIKALKCHKKAYRIFKEIGDRTGEGANLFSIGVVHYFTGEFQKALKYYQDSLKIFKEEKDKWREGMTLGNIGVIYSQMGNYQKALEVYNKSLKIDKELGARVREGSDLINIGITLEHTGNYVDALEKFLEGVQINHEIGNRAGKADGNSNIGRVYNQLGDYKSALDYLEKTLDIRKETGDRRGEGSALNNIGDVFENLEEYDKALEIQNMALLLGKEFNSKTLWIDSLNSLASVYTKRGGNSDSVAALPFAREATKLSQEASLPHREITGLSLQAKANLLMENPSEALKCSEKAVSLLEKLEQMESLEDRIYFNHFEVLQKNKDGGNAKAYLKRAYDEVTRKSKWIKDDEMRKNFLNKVRLNQNIIESWKRLKNFR
jgi:diguanylate cyclase (GGDEF)-like protein